MFNTFWYDNLNKPFLSPPDWIFMPMWTLLYITIFISLIFYIYTKPKNKTSGYIYFAAQIILNIIWTPLFFILQNISLALIDILLLDIFTILTIRKFYSISKISGILLIPYLLWIAFATYLNIGYFILN